MKKYRECVRNSLLAEDSRTHVVAGVTCHSIYFFIGEDNEVTER